jgi:hypothetical protein
MINLLTAQIKTGLIFKSVFLYAVFSLLLQKISHFFNLI